MGYSGTGGRAVTVTEGWAYGGAPQTAGAVGTVTLIEGSTFCLSGRSGDISAAGEPGLFFRDTRFVSSLRLEVSGQSPDPLTARVLEPFAGEFLSRRHPRAGTAD